MKAGVGVKGLWNTRKLMVICSYLKKSDYKIWTSKIFSYQQTALEKYDVARKFESVTDAATTKFKPDLGRYCFQWHVCMAQLFAPWVSWEILNGFINRVGSYLFLLFLLFTPSPILNEYDIIQSMFWLLQWSKWLFTCINFSDLHSHESSQQFFILWNH